MMSHCSPSEWSMRFGRKGDWSTFRAGAGYHCPGRCTYSVWKRDPEGDAMKNEREEEWYVKLGKEAEDCYE